MTARIVDLLDGPYLCVGDKQLEVSRDEIYALGRNIDAWKVRHGLKREQQYERLYSWRDKDGKLVEPRNVEFV